MNIKQTWLEHFAQAGRSKVYNLIKTEPLPESDWADYSREKVDDFLKSVLASFALVGDGTPFSTVETGVFAGGTSAVFLHALGSRCMQPSMHVGIDPYFLQEQSYPRYREDYGAAPQLIALRDLSAIAFRVGLPYMPFFMSSDTFMRKDLLPQGFDFRVFHLDGDHSAPAVLQELEYFSSKVTNQAVFILDDIGEGFPGVMEAVTRFQESHPHFTELSKFCYATRSGNIGFGVYHLSVGKRDFSTKPGSIA